MGSTVFDVDELPTHGGSLRIYARHDDDRTNRSAPAVKELLRARRRAGLTNARALHARSTEQVEETKRDAARFSHRRKRAGKRSPATARRARATRC